MLNKRGTAKSTSSIHIRCSTDSIGSRRPRPGSLPLSQDETAMTGRGKVQGRPADAIGNQQRVIGPLSIRWQQLFSNHGVIVGAQMSVQVGHLEGMAWSEC